MHDRGQSCARRVALRVYEANLSPGVEVRERGIMDDGVARVQPGDTRPLRPRRVAQGKCLFPRSRWRD